MNAINNIYAAFPPEHSLGIEKRAAIVELSLGRNLAYGLQLPATPVDNLNQYYGEHLEGQVRNAVAKFNEGFPLNTARVMALTYVLWRCRYNLVHRPRFNTQVLLRQAMIENDPISRDLAPCYLDVVQEEMPYAAEDIIRDFTTTLLPL